ncbi:PIN-like domain-containing protein [Providencia rettgeri]|uniref:PIN-like domain-containing protein n=1 Tax=Providencia rettgeri TaxID=587 RepID=UPI0018C4951C|nr:PIN-like domain-containing protein [Providencia rettgeri]MBG5923699.1 hypothetical protein [Providencia rettgeri]
MRDKFKGFYGNSVEDEMDAFLSNKTIFIFDTNCFLNLYRCDEDTKNDFMNVIDNIKDRIWFPFQVCLEYQRNRIKVISSSMKNLNEIKQELMTATKVIDIFCNESQKSIKNRYSQLHVELCNLKEEIEGKINNFISESIDNRLSKSDLISKSDDIRSWIDTVSIEKISEPLTQEQIDRINKEGERRYKAKIGPGWEDERDKKDSESYFDGVYYKDKYGDLYLWTEILNKVESDDEVENIIFVTNDVKDDWWYREHGKTIGPLECINTEIKNKNINFFNMYTQSSFLSKATNLLDKIHVNDSSIEELERLSDNILNDDLSCKLLNSKKTYDDNNVIKNPTLDTYIKQYANLQRKYSGLLDSGKAALEIARFYNTSNEDKIEHINSSINRLEEKIMECSARRDGYIENYARLPDSGAFAENERDELDWQIGQCDNEINTLKQEIRSLTAYLYTLQ